MSQAQKNSKKRVLHKTDADLDRNPGRNAGHVVLSGFPKRGVADEGSAEQPRETHGSHPRMSSKTRVGEHVRENASLDDHRREAEWKNCLRSEVREGRIMLREDHEMGSRL